MVQNLLSEPACIVLIESDWNLKPFRRILTSTIASVLIKSDWNLKRDIELSTIAGAGSINKIRLEFKGGSQPKM